MAKDIQFSYSGIFPKETCNSMDGDSIVDIVAEGREPGCSRDTIIVAGDSYDDIVSFINSSKRGGKVLDGDVDDERLMRILRDEPSVDRGAMDEQKTGPRERSESPDGAGSGGGRTGGKDAAESADGRADVQLRRKPIDRHEDSASRPVVLDDGRRNAISSVEQPGPDWRREEWRQQGKHVFVLSCSGKPIYTRYGDADQQASLFGTLLTLSQFLQHTQDNQSPGNKDVLRCITAGSRRMVFVASELVVMVVVSRSIMGSHPEPVHSLVLQMTYVYNQIVSVLSLSRLKAIYEQRPNFDLRRLLAGSEKFVDSLLEAMDRDPGFLLCSVRCLPFDNSQREVVAQTVFSQAKIKDLVFAVLITGNQLIALVRMKQFLLHPVDLHILFNLVSSESFKHAESWTPVCLPKFDPNGYLHCHISYLDDDCQVCLLLLSVNKDTFYNLSECRKKIKERLIKNNSLSAVKQALAGKTKDPGIPELLHFVYKARSTGQFIESDHARPYDTPEERARLFAIFRHVFCLMHAPGQRLKIYYHSGDREAVLGWITMGFELFAVFGPFTGKSAAIQAVNRLLKWIKKEEGRFFILNSHTF